MSMLNKRLLAVGPHLYEVQEEGKTNDSDTEGWLLPRVLCWGLGASGTEWYEGNFCDNGSVPFLNLESEYMSHTVISLNYAFRICTYCYV